LLRADRRGFTLVEMLIVVGIVGLLMLVGFPKAQAALRKSQLRSARNAAINQYQQARTRAINEGRPVTLNLDGTSMWVTAQPRRNAGPADCDCDTIGTVQDLNAKFGVAMSYDAATYTVDARGLGTTPGTDNKIVFTRSGVRDSFTLGGYGRIIK
jgi:prepilin-type N-terminal cleavage/methylation domain-containing protein